METNRYTGSDAELRRDLRLLHLMEVTDQVVALLHGLNCAEADEVLESAKARVETASVFNLANAGIDERKASHVEFAARARSEHRRRAYVAKATVEGRQERLQELARCRATGVPLEELETEFGRDFLNNRAEG